MMSHVKSFGSPQTNFGVKNAMSGGIVGFKGSASGRLFVSHFFKSGNHGNGFLGVEEKTTCFSFGGRGGNSTNGFAKNVNSTIGFGVRWRAGGTGKVCKKEMTGGAAASIRKGKIGSVRADGEDHVTGAIPNGSIRMRGKVVKKHVAGLFGLFRGGGLAVGDFVQGNNDCGVTATGIVEKKAGNLLDAVDAEFVE